MLIDRRDRRPILLTNARVIDPSRDLDFPGDVLIADGAIREAKRGIGAAGVPEGAEIVECRGNIVAPGLIDMRAFIGEPGAEGRESIASASQAAAAGGVTTIVCQPETEPAIDDPTIVDYIQRRARDTAIVHVHAMAALTKGLKGQEMTEIGLLKAAGAVAFTDGMRSVINAQVMRRALIYARDFDVLIVHHTEDPDLTGEGVMNEGEFASRLGLIGVPKIAETIMLERDMRFVALTDGRYHAASVTCPESLEVLRRAKPKLPMCLEMITRDPLKVPYKTDKYWASFGGRDAARVAAFEKGLLSKASAEDLPRVSALGLDKMQEREDENVRRSTAYARESLKL